MKISTFIFSILLFAAVVLNTSCRTQFEKIRTSNDGQLIYKEAEKFYEAGDFGKAQSLYELAIPAYRGKKEAEEIFYKYAYAHYNLKQYILASHYFKNFANTYVNSDRREEADYMSAYSNYLLSPQFKLDQSYSLKAIEGFQLFVNTYPYSERVTECNKLIDQIRDKLERKAFAEGILYYDLKHYSSAVQSFENMLKDFPETSRAEEVRYLVAKSSHILADNSIFDKKEVRFLEVVEKCNAFSRKYNNSEFMAEVNKYKDNAIKELNKINNG